MADVPQHNGQGSRDGRGGCSVTIGDPTQATLAGDTVRILVGDSRQVLGQIAPGTIQCCVTSPPYWGLRDYDHGDQIGAEPSPEKYLSNLVAVFQGVRRALRDNGTLWLNVGDGYARNGGTGRSGPNALVAIPGS